MGVVMVVAVSACCAGLWSNHSLVVLLKRGEKKKKKKQKQNTYRRQLDRVTDAAPAELTGTGRGDLPGMSQRQLTCDALGRGYPHSIMLQYGRM